MRALMDDGLHAIVGARSIVGADPWTMTPSKPLTQEDLRDELTKTWATTFTLGTGMMLFSEQHKRAGAFLMRLSLVFGLPAVVVAMIPKEDWAALTSPAPAPASPQVKP